MKKIKYRLKELCVYNEEENIYFMKILNIEMLYNGNYDKLYIYNNNHYFYIITHDVVILSHYLNFRFMGTPKYYNLFDFDLYSINLDIDKKGNLCLQNTDSSSRIFEREFSGYICIPNKQVPMFCTMLSDITKIIKK